MQQGPGTFQALAGGAEVAADNPFENGRGRRIDRQIVASSSVYDQAVERTPVIADLPGGFLRFIWLAQIAVE
ncbi:hypothetical protein D3C72_1815460 [compost metagenome]